MHELLAAAFGIASNQIDIALFELYEAYDNLIKAGIKLSADDKAQFDQQVKRIRELSQFLHDVEFNAMVDRINKQL